jgi:hypothetical protein
LPFFFGKNVGSIEKDDFSREDVLFFHLYFSQLSFISKLKTFANETRDHPCYNRKNI